MSRPRLLFLAQTLPYPPDGGVHIRTFHVLRHLARTFEVDALFFYRRAARSGSNGIAESAGELRRYASVDVFPIPQEEWLARRIWDHVRSVIRHRPYTLYAYESRAFRSTLGRRLRDSDYDLVHVDSLDLSGYLPLLSGLPVVCAHHNVESELLARRADSTSNRLAKGYLRHQAGLLAREEERWCPRVAMNVIVSERDRRTLEERIPNACYTVVPNGVDVAQYRPTEGEKAGMVFVGGSNWFPNRDALDHFTRDILPLVRTRKPEAGVKWVGETPTRLRRKVERRHRIEMTGYVEDIRPHVGPAACYVVPLRVGGGTRLKILDAWAMGKAVVSTSQGCEGLEASDGRNILIRDEPEAFAEAVCRVLSDPGLRERLGREARRTAERLYSWEVIGERMNRTYRGLLEESPQESVGMSTRVGGAIRK